jgi:hypothetical protein
MMSPKKYVDGIGKELASFLIVADLASDVMEGNQTVGGCFQVRSSKPTIQPNRPPMTA